MATKNDKPSAPLPPAGGGRNGARGRKRGAASLPDQQQPLPLADLEVIAPNFKRRLSGVTSTIVRLVPLQAKKMAIRATGPGLPAHVPRIALWKTLFLPRKRAGRPVWRVWHARRNVEMIWGLMLRHVFRRRLKLLFTSASQRRHTRFSRFLIARMDGVIATSEATRRYLEVPAAVIHHGIDLAGFRPRDAEAKRALRRRLGLPEEAVIVGNFGRIRAQKGTDVFVDAMLEVMAERPQVVGIVLGRATEKHAAFRAGLEHKIAAAGMAERLRILPEVPVHEVADWFATLDLFVAPQRWEGFGLTPLEAMASGVPVVATTVGAFPELLAPGETGTLVPPGDADAMAEAIAAYLDDPARCMREGQAGRRRVEQCFQLEREADALIEVYRALIEGKPVPGAIPPDRDVGDAKTL